MIWWNKKYGRDKICPINRTRLRPGKNKYGLSHTLFLPCQHGFCRSALIKWVSVAVETKNLSQLSNPDSPSLSRPSCPLCRKLFNPWLVFGPRVITIR
jgi:hypothetical protein